MMDKKSMQTVANKAVRGHEKRMHKGMKKGGVTTADLKKYGRNEARIQNQKTK
jgi:hypothetical protein